MKQNIPRINVNLDHHLSLYIYLILLATTNRTSDSLTCFYYIFPFEKWTLKYLDKNKVFISCEKMDSYEYGKRLLLMNGCVQLLIAVSTLKEILQPLQTI